MQSQSETQNGDQINDNLTQLLMIEFTGCLKLNSENSIQLGNIDPRE